MLVEEQILDLWDTFADHLDAKAKGDCAIKFVHWCVDNGINEETLYEVADQEPYLKEAIEEVLGTERDEDVEDYGDDNWDYNDYED